MIVIRPMVIIGNGKILEAGEHQRRCERAALAKRIIDAAKKWRARSGPIARNAGLAALGFALRR
jgi:hypothetical protein